MSGVSGASGKQHSYNIIVSGHVGLSPGPDHGDLPGVLLGKLYDVLLYELPHSAGAPVTLTELDGQPGQLRHEPAQAVPQGRVTVDPARLEKHTFTTHTVAMRFLIF